MKKASSQLSKKKDKEMNRKSFLKEFEKIKKVNFFLDSYFRIAKLLQMQMIGLSDESKKNFRECFSISTKNGILSGKISKIKNQKLKCKN